MLDYLGNIPWLWGLGDESGVPYTVTDSYNSGMTSGYFEGANGYAGMWSGNDAGGLDFFATDYSSGSIFGDSDYTSFFSSTTSSGAYAYSLFDSWLSTGIEGNTILNQSQFNLINTGNGGLWSGYGTDDGSITGMSISTFDGQGNNAGSLTGPAVNALSSGLVQSAQADAVNSYLAWEGSVVEQLTPEYDERNATLDIASMLFFEFSGGGASRFLLGGSSRSTTGTVTRTNAELLQEIANRAARQNFEGSPVVQGTLRHSYADRLLTRYQRMFGDRELSTEVRYLDGYPNQSGLGSIRLDVVEGPLNKPTFIFDYKFGRSGLTQRRISKIRSVGNFDKNVPIIEVKPSQ